MTLSLEQIQQNVERYTEVRDELNRLRWQRLEALEIANRSYLEEMKADLAGRALAPVSRRYYELAEALERRMDDLTKELPCNAFAERFCWEMHEWFKEEHPINHETTLRDFSYLPMSSPIFRYPIHEPMSITALTDGAIPAIVPVKIGESRIERWGFPSKRIEARLAYAPELNVVFVFERQ